MRKPSVFASRATAGHSQRYLFVSELNLQSDFHSILNRLLHMGSKMGSQIKSKNEVLNFIFQLSFLNYNDNISQLFYKQLIIKLIICGT